MKIRFALLVATASLAAVACGGAAQDTVAGPGIDDGSTGAPPAAAACLEGATDCNDMGGDMGSDGGGDELPPPNIVEPRPGMDDVHAVDWDQASVENDQTVTVAWWSGVEPCNVLDHVEVDYSDDAVTITVFEGSEPSDEEQACIEIAERRGTVIELDEPLGPRSLLDGADE